MASQVTSLKELKRRYQSAPLEHSQQVGAAVDLGDIGAITSFRLHEATGSTRHSLAFCMASRIGRRVFWVGEGRSVQALRARGVQRFMDTDQLVTIQTANRAETLWAGEEALRCAGVGLVVMECAVGPDLFESRRLQIAAQAGRTTGLTLIGRRAQASACQTRWHCTAETRSGTLAGTWRWSLTKDKQGPEQSWEAHWEDSKRTSRAFTPANLFAHAAAKHEERETFDEPVRGQVRAMPGRVVSEASP